MKNTLGNLNEQLFAQLERLNNKDLVGDELNEEINRAKAVTGVAEQIIATGSLVLKAQVAVDNRLNADTKKPTMLEG